MINNKKKYGKKTNPFNVNQNSQLPNNKKYMGLDAFPKRDYAPSNYIQDKYSQYRIGIDNYWPLQITNMPFYNDVFYSMPNSLGSPIYMKPSYETMENASFSDTLSSQHYSHQMDTNQYALIDRQFPGLQFENMDAFSMEKDSYFNTMNAHNKEVNYKDFTSHDIEEDKKPVKPKKREIVYIDSNKDVVNMSVIMLLIFILLLNY